MTARKSKSLCIDCNAAFAYRTGGRCHECHVINQRERLVAFVQRIKTDPAFAESMRKKKRAKERAKRLANAKPRKSPDASIQLYRAHKEQSRAVAEYNAIMAEAKREYEAQTARRQPMGKAA